MKKALYPIGRLLQVVSLIALPGAIWAGELVHSEVMAISIFVGSVFTFVLGYLLTR